MRVSQCYLCCRFADLWAHEKIFAKLHGTFFPARCCLWPLRFARFSQFFCVHILSAARFPPSDSFASLHRVLPCSSDIHFSPLGASFLLSSLTLSFFFLGENPNDVWKEAKAANGKVYYYNRFNKSITTWKKPAGFGEPWPPGGAALPPPPAAVPQQLPPPMASPMKLPAPAPIAAAPAPMDFASPFDAAPAPAPVSAVPPPFGGGAGGMPPPMGMGGPLPGMVKSPSGALAKLPPPGGMGRPSLPPVSQYGEPQSEAPSSPMMGGGPKFPPVGGLAKLPPPTMMAPPPFSQPEPAPTQLETMEEPSNMPPPAGLPTAGSFPKMGFPGMLPPVGGAMKLPPPGGMTKMPGPPGMMPPPPKPDFQPEPEPVHAQQPAPGGLPPIGAPMKFPLTKLSGMPPPVASPSSLHSDPEPPAPVGPPTGLAKMPGFPGMLPPVGGAMKLPPPGGMPPPPAATPPPPHTDPEPAPSPVGPPTGLPKMPGFPGMLPPGGGAMKLPGVPPPHTDPEPIASPTPLGGMGKMPGFPGMMPPVGGAMKFPGPPPPAATPPPPASDPEPLPSPVGGPSGGPGKMPGFPGMLPPVGGAMKLPGPPPPGSDPAPPSALPGLLPERKNSFLPPPFMGGGATKLPPPPGGMPPPPGVGPGTPPPSNDPPPPAHMPGPPGPGMTPRKDSEPHLATPGLPPPTGMPSPVLGRPPGLMGSPGKLPPPGGMPPPPGGMPPPPGTMPPPPGSNPPPPTGIPPPAFGGPPPASDPAPLPGSNSSPGLGGMPPVGMPASRPSFMGGPGSLPPPAGNPPPPSSMPPPPGGMGMPSPLGLGVPAPSNTPPPPMNTPPPPTSTPPPPSTMPPPPGGMPPPPGGMGMPPPSNMPPPPAATPEPPKIPEPEPEPEPEPITVLLLQTVEVDPSTGAPVMAEPQIGGDGQPMFVNVQQYSPDGMPLSNPDGSPVLVLMFQTVEIGNDGTAKLAQPALDNTGNLIYQHIQRVPPKPTKAVTLPPPGPGGWPKVVKIKLPGDTRQVIPFKPEQRLREALEKVCRGRAFAVDEYIPKGKDGKELGLDLMMAEINQDEISFVTPKHGQSANAGKQKAQKSLAEIHALATSLASSLTTTLKTYREPMVANSRDPDKKKKLLTEEQVNQIFASLENVAEMSKAFTNALVPQLNAWPMHVADIFQRHMDIIPHYGTYLNGFKAAMNLLEELRKSDALNEFLDNIQKSTGSKLRLEDFLALPASKIISLAQFIDDVANGLTDSISMLQQQAAQGLPASDPTPDIQALQGFSQRMAVLTSTATTLRLSHESRTKIRFLEVNVEGLPKKQPLMDEKGERFFFREGVVDLSWKKSKKATTMQVYLFTDMLLVCSLEKKKDKKKASLKFEDWIPFAPGGTAADESGNQYNFGINVADKKEKHEIKFTITSQTEGTKAEWVASIKQACADLQAKPHLVNGKGKK